MPAKPNDDARYPRRQERRAQRGGDSTGSVRDARPSCTRSHDRRTSGSRPSPRRQNGQRGPSPAVREQPHKHAAEAHPFDGAT